MAMEKIRTLRDTHSRGITTLGFHPTRKEIFAGFEDGMIKIYENDKGKMVQSYWEHRGWVTDFHYWSDRKLMLSCSNDGQIVAWVSGGGLEDKISVGQPVYCLVINPRRKQLVCGVGDGLLIYNLDEDRTKGHIIEIRPLYYAREHSDMVMCLQCNESRIYSAGYDQKLIIYDSSYTGEKHMDPVHIIHNAHDAGISTMCLVKDNDLNFWIVTGSFDKTVKIWSPDGKVVHVLEGFMSTVTGLCYVPKNKTIWAVGGTQYAQLYDPRSGDNVSDFIGTFNRVEDESYILQKMRYCHEAKIVVASTNRKTIVIWKYNPSGCITTLKCQHSLESLAYTRKIPILFFSGDSEGNIVKWERMQTNTFMYSNERFPLDETQKVRKVGTKERTNIWAREETEWYRSGDADDDDDELDKPVSAPDRFENIKSVYSGYNKPMVVKNELAFEHQNTTILCMEFVEELDTFVAGCEDNNIYMWCFDSEAVNALQMMNLASKQQDSVGERFSILLGKGKRSSTLQKEEDYVTKRVAGFICQYMFCEHYSYVSCLQVIGRNEGFDSTYLVSGGWDRRLIIWDLEKGSLVDVFKNNAIHGSKSLLTPEYLTENEYACDGVITSIAYCPQRNHLAYASADKMVYIRKFSTNSLEMTLLNTLQGHFGEVTSVLYNVINDVWVTGSEDGTIRIWDTDGMNEELEVLGMEKAITTLCVDQTNGALVAGCEENIVVYEPENYHLVQIKRGHTDSVRSIIHIKERNQYVSTSWDHTIRIWNAYEFVPMKGYMLPEGGKKNRTGGTAQNSKVNSPAESYGLENSELSNEYEESPVAGSPVIITP